MLRVSLPGNSKHYFKVFYIARNEEEVSEVAACIDVLVELGISPYKESIISASNNNSSVKEYLEKHEQEGSLLLPVLLNKKGCPKYLVNRGRNSPARSKLEYWRSVGTDGLVDSYRNIGLSPSQFTVYPGFKDLIVCGERRGNPCVYCPNVLGSIGNKPSCNFGCGQCLTHLNLKKLVEESNED
mgnify:CR=1 FL=1